MIPYKQATKQVSKQAIGKYAKTASPIMSLESNTQTG